MGGVMVLVRVGVDGGGRDGAGERSGWGVRGVGEVLRAVLRTCCSLHFTRQHSPTLTHSLPLTHTHTHTQTHSPTPTQPVPLPPQSLQHSQGSWSPPSPTATPAALAALARQLLTRKRDLLGSCFGIDITDCGRIVSLPLLLDRYHPDLDRLPGLVLDLATRVEWGEKACFR